MTLRSRETYSRDVEARVRCRAVVVLLALAAFVSLLSASGEEEARRSARLFGQALTSGRASLLRPLLPESGKVHLCLEILGPEEGFFGASQVEALLGDFLSQAEVRSFELLRFDSDGKSNAFAHGRAVLIDKQGRPARVGLRLVFAPENGHWVLREIRETQE